MTFLVEEIVTMIDIVLVVSDVIFGLWAEFRKSVLFSGEEMETMRSRDLF